MLFTYKEIDDNTITEESRRRMHSDIYNVLESGETGESDDGPEDESKTIRAQLADTTSDALTSAEARHITSPLYVRQLTYLC